MHLPWRPMNPAPDGPPILTSITQAEADELSSLAEGAKVLEIGAAYGFSTVVMALTAESVVSIDPHRTHDSYGMLLSNVHQYRVDKRVDVRRDTSQFVLPELVAESMGFDLVFIDGDHTTAGVSHDIEWSLKLIRDGGVIAIHDVLEQCCCPDIKPVVESMFSSYDLVDSMAVVTL